jgi:hypothetical protein
MRGFGRLVLGQERAADGADDGHQDGDERPRIEGAANAAGAGLGHLLDHHGDGLSLAEARLASGDFMISMFTLNGR